MKDADLQALFAAFQADLGAASDLRGVEGVRVKYLGRKSALKAAFKDLRNLQQHERPGRAKDLNDLNASMEARLGEVIEQLRSDEVERRLSAEWIDPHLPGIAARRGARHPVAEVERRCLEVLRQLGFVFVDGPEVESLYYNFDALNIPEHHPARDMQDTFWVADDLVLRSHTTPVQARVLEQRRPLPIKVASAGRVYRNEAVDATHLAMFHQLEGFWVDHRINFSHLKGVLAFMARALYGEERKIRFKPKFYPYTEPSIGLDVVCAKCAGDGCEACHDAGWITIIGAGMVHPKILQQFDYTQPGVRGFAFGWGTTRMASQWLGLSKIKSLYEQDLRLFAALHRRWQ